MWTLGLAFILAFLPFKERQDSVEAQAARWGISEELATHIVRAADRHAIDQQVAFRLVWVESQFNPRARSPVGARGLTQLMPATAKLLEDSITIKHLYDPVTNLDLGFRYLAEMRNRYGGDLRYALAAYNVGPKKVDEWYRRRKPMRGPYVRRILH